MYFLCEILEQARLIYSAIKPINGCWIWRGVTIEGQEEISFWGGGSVLNLGWSGHMFTKLYT